MLTADRIVVLGSRPCGTIRDTTDQTSVFVVVSDNGPGIPEELQPEIFVRSDHARSRSTGSAGLGLAIVHAVITARGKTATVTISPGHTTFCLTLPD
ncbi:ATP-binding protein [Streptomyces sp. BE133]|uniref:ATP-binding protein n=1 Tax=Streptomyces sp. BE133 TaxID=3002523 RepID=UPI002E79BD12|nr:ATP-binding protein [Streptomyces sp. BE133]MEE1810093.1 ATP-binding protein [Streptomyces sp. BE133]